MDRCDRVLFSIIGAFLLWLGCCSKANAAITGPGNCAFGFSATTVISVQTVQFGTRGSNCATPAANTAGNFILVHYGYTLNTGTILAVSATDTQGNTYTAIAEEGPFDEIFSGMFYAKNIAGGSGNQVTVTLAATTGGLSNFYVYAEEYTGVDTVSPLDTFNLGSATGLSISIGLTTATINELVVSNVNSNVNLGTVSAGSGYTLGYQGHNNYAVQSQVFATAATHTSVTTWTSAGSHVAGIVAAFKAASTPAANFTVYHYTAGVLTGTTQWAPDGWGDGTNSHSTGGLKGALANASACDQIVLHHGVVYAAPNTTASLQMPVTDSSDCQLLITGDDNKDLPASGNRVCTGYCQTPPPQMPVIQAAVNFSQPLLGTAACGIHDFEFRGIAFSVANGGSNVISSVLVAGAPGDGSILPQCQGHRWSFDQIWAAGNYNQPGPCRAFYIEAADSRIINSYLDEFGEYGQDCQAIYTTSWNNVLVQNNWIGATTENFMCGGSGESIAGASCTHANFIGNYLVKHIQWRVFASNVNPTDARPSCVYYPPDNGYDGNGGGEIWVNGTSSLAGSGGFPPTGPGPGVTTSTVTTGSWWQCSPGGTWVAQAGPKTFSSKYGSGMNVTGQQGNIKNAWELKYGQDYWFWGNILANSWNAQQNELLILNGPYTSLQQGGTCPNIHPTTCLNLSRGTFNVNIEYNILRDSIGGFSAGGGFAGMANADPFKGIQEHNVLMDNVSSAARMCNGCNSSAAIPAQAGGVQQLGQTPTYFASPPLTALMLPGGWVIRHLTSVNNAAAAGILNYGGGRPDITTPTLFQGNVGPALLDNVLSLGRAATSTNGGISGAGDPTPAQTFNSGGFTQSGCNPPGPSFVMAPGGILANNIISEDNANGLGGGVFNNVGQPCPASGANGPAFNGTGQGVTMSPPGNNGNVATSSCCFLNYLPAVTPTNATPGTQATWNSSNLTWTYPDYTLSSSSTACNPDTLHPIGQAPAAPQSCKGKATDGTDPGADLPTVYGFTANTIAGTSNPNLRFRISSITRVSNTSVLISYQAPIGAPQCTVTVSPNENMSSPVGSADPGGVTPTYNVQINGLSGHFFWATLGCLDQVNAGPTLIRKFNFQL
jgi:hypothetical protein